MEAKDTVLTKAEMKKALQQAKCPSGLIIALGNDINLWWKAGWLQEILLAQKQAGIEEVVEWIEKDSVHKDGLSHYCPNCDHTILGVNPYQWQAKLKEWGVKENDK